MIGGVDEVGRGAFAGPLVAGCVVFKPNVFALSSRLRSQKDARNIRVYINDSKKLTSKQREVSSKWIKENALSWGIGSVSAKQIDKFGLTKAANSAFRRAINSAQKRGKLKIDQLMVDAFYIPNMKGIPQKNQFAIIGADGKSMSVAAASIIAKVYRDELMAKLATKNAYQKYSWDKNKGYGTKNHREIIKKYGTTQYHRKLFLRKLI